MKLFKEVIKNNLKLIIFYVVLGMTFAFLGLYATNYFQVIIDSFGTNEITLKMIVFYGMVLLVTAIIGYIDNYPDRMLFNKLYLEFKKQSMKKLKTIDYQEYRRIGTGRLSQQVEEGATSARDAIYYFWLKLLRELLPGALISLFFIGKTKIKLVHEIFFTAFEILVTIIKIVMLIYAVISKNLTIGEIVVLITLLGKAYEPIAIFNVEYIDYKLNKVSLKRYLEYLDLQDVPNMYEGKKLKKVSGSISLRNVTFAYKEKIVLENLNLEIKENSIVVFVGETGSGKSTIVQLIAGLIKPQSGTVFIDNKDLNKIKLDSYYEHLSYLSQDSPIFDGTLKENIVFDKDVQDEKIIEVLKLVELEKFYSKLKNGLETELGERGILISGGERQRIALARLFFDDSKIIILDEATSGVYINKDLTIDGNNNIIDKSDCSRYFIFVDKESTLNLINITIDGGATGFEVNEEGLTGTNYTIPLKTDSDINDPKQLSSAIMVLGNLNTDNITMSNNYTSSNGGAIYIVSGNLNIKNSQFIHNRSKSGGVIASEKNLATTDTSYSVKSINIENSKFKDNYANGGGAIRAINTEEINLTKTEFISNRANGTTGGGAILLHKQNASGYATMAEKLGIDFIQLKVDQCLFDDNWSGNDGYAIESHDSEMYITNTTFKNNVGTYRKTAVGTVSTLALRKEYHTILFDNCNFDNNRGGSSVFGDHAGTANITFSNTNFSNNNGMMSILIYSGNANFTNCSFQNERVEQGVISINSHYKETDTKFKPQIINMIDLTFNNTIGATDILLRKYSRDISMYDSTTYIKGNTTAKIDVWDNNKLIIEGTNNGEINIDVLTEESSFTISENATVNGLVDLNRDTYMVTLYYPYFKDGGELRYYLYLDKDKTYTEKEIYMMHKIGEKNYKLEYYTDKEYTTKWDFGTTEVTSIYGKWVEHTHKFNSGTVEHEGLTYNQCECGYFEVQNPPTGDNIIKVIIMTFISMFSLIFTIKKYRKQ